MIKQLAKSLKTTGEGSTSGHYVKALKCRECGKEFPPTKILACEHCFGPLEVVYDLKSIRLGKDSFSNRPKTLWRYRELLPLKDEGRTIDLGAGFTPLRECKRLADALGLKRLYIKDDTVNPTGSFKDRPASVAVSKAIELGFDAVGCVSTGNLAAAASAHAAKAGIPCYVLIPSNIEADKIVQTAIYGAKIISIKGTYDEANMIALQASEEYNWALVNVNIRPYYVEGSKTLGFEICEQLGWRPPDHIIIPMGSGALLCAVWRGLKQLSEIGLIRDLSTRITGAQPSGRSPIVNAFKLNSDEINPVERTETIAKSLAIGDPADGAYALRIIRETGGMAESASDEEILEAIRLLGETEGIYSEPAGGVTIAALKKLVDSGAIRRDEEVVCCVTGNGFKSSETLRGAVSKPIEINPNIEELDKFLRRWV
ncbi:MAG: threonine synthase [Thermoproteota archaeon]